MTTLDDLTDDELLAAQDRNESRGRLIGGLTGVVLVATLGLATAYAGHSASSPAPTPHDYLAEVQGQFVVVERGTTFQGSSYTLEVARASDGTVCDRLTEGMTSGGGCGGGGYGFSTSGLEVHGVVSDDVATVEVGGASGTQQVATKPLPPQFGHLRFFHVQLLRGDFQALTMTASDGRVLSRSTPH